MEQEDVTDNFEIIDNNQESKDEFGHNYGSDTKYMSREDIDALLNGRLLATDINGGEYTLFIALCPEELEDDI